MIDDCPPKFHAISKNYLYQIYVTASDMLFVELGRGRKYGTTKFNTGHGTVITGGLMGGMIGGMAAAEAQRREIEKQHEQDAQNLRIEEEGHLLANYNTDAIRSFIRSQDAGFIARPKDLDLAVIEDVTINAFLGMGGKSKPALIIDHRDEGERTFIFKTKADAVTALCEIDRLLGNELEIEIPVSRYKKSIAKYKKWNNRKAKPDDSPVPYTDDDDDDCLDVLDEDLVDEQPSAKPLALPQDGPVDERPQQSEGRTRRPSAQRRDDRDSARDQRDLPRDRRDSRRDRGSSKLPWIIGGSVAAVLVLIGVLVLIFSGESKNKKNDFRQERNRRANVVG